MVLKLKIVLPDGLMEIGRLRSVVLQTPDGEIGILPGHLPIVGLLDIGLLVATTADRQERFVTGGGMLWVADDCVSVLLIDLIAEKDLDEAAAKRMLEDARAALAMHELASQPEAREERLKEARYAEAQLALLARRREA